MEVSCHLLGYGWTYDQVISGWQEIEELGFDACYAPDDMSVHHMDAVPHCDVGENVFETWTILSAVASQTKRIRIGSLVSPCGRRHPVMLAKMTSAVDVISGGRLTLGMGTGNSPDQYQSMGVPFPGPVERTAMLNEELHIIRSLWTQARTTFRGRYYTAENAVNSPKPIQQPHPEILIAFKSRKYVPRIAAEYADRVNILGADDSGVLAALHAFVGACREQDRDPETVIKSRMACVVFTDGEVDRNDRRKAIRERAIEIGFDPDELVEDLEKYLLPYVGPPSGCAEALKKRTADLGFQEIIITIDAWGLNRYENTMSGFRTFAREVMPQLRDS